MPSLDVVSKVDVQALDNAINNLKREVATRFDFRNTKTEITFDKKEKTLHVVTGDEMKAKEVKDMLIGRATRQQIDPRYLVFKPIEPHTRDSVKMDVEVKDGLNKETCQKIVKYIKSLKMKVEPVSQDEQVRVSGKKIDDLQAIMQQLDGQDFGVPLQYVNMKS